jgi:hypothetical protein
LKHVVARATTYLVVALLLVLALRFSPEIPERPAAAVLHSADSAQTDSTLVAAAAARAGSLPLPYGTAPAR